MTKKVLLLIFIVFGSFLLTQAQKSKVIAVFQLIETAKYNEAKRAVEEAIVEEKTMEWPRTWYARGLLCQTAYEKGMAENDRKKYELYPDQLYLAYESYEKAISLDKRGKIAEQLSPSYVLLANSFQKLGEKHFNSKKYEDALKAFEHALLINKSPILSVKIDTNLIYNAALAAYESKEWEKAILYLNELNEDNYSPNVAHLLFTVYLENADTISAEQVLIDAIDRYEANEDLVLLLVDFLFKTDDVVRAVAILDSTSSQSPLKYIFPYTKGLIYQKTEQYKYAIEAYKEALSLAPEEFNIYTNIGTCYYNIGVEIEENARSIKNNRAFLEEKTKSKAAFQSAVNWFEKAHEKDSDNQTVITKLYQLYKILGITDKIKNLEVRVN